jgi:hypothetical protein
LFSSFAAEFDYRRDVCPVIQGAHIEGL